MSKKPSSSIDCKQSSLLTTQQNTTTHSLSRRKRYLTVVTPSQLDHKPLKTLKEIKRIALGARTTPSPHNTEKVTKRKIVPTEQIPTQMKEINSWKRELTLDLKPLQFQEKCVEFSARTMETKLEYSRFQAVQTPINRLLLESTVGYYNH